MGEKADNSIKGFVKKSTCTSIKDQKVKQN